ncbi:MAG: iron-sulfur cluster assembly scaffold protein [Verrucomicrobiales bacterium]
MSTKPTTTARADAAVGDIAIKPTPVMPPENSSPSTEDRIREAIARPHNMGEMTDADAVGTVGSPECGDMVRMWLKFREKDGQKVIDRASFQSFGCQTAIAVASVATELLAGKTLDEAMAMDATALSRPLGPLPPMKIHCGQMVEGALREALEAEKGTPVAAPSAPGNAGDTLIGSFAAAQTPLKQGGRIRVVKHENS